jgi:lipopolysaccharide transport system ATP-binding protein
VAPEQDSFRPDEEKRIRFVLEKREPNLPPLYLSAHVVDASGQVVAQCDSRLVGVEVVASGAAEGCFVLKSPWLKPGDYHVDLFICGAGMGILDLFERSCKLTVLPLLPYEHGASAEAAQMGCVLSEFDWHLGCAPNRARG